jgi:hypothetical protein
MPIKRAGSDGRSIFLTFWNLQKVVYFVNKPQYWLTLALKLCSKSKEKAHCGDPIVISNYAESSATHVKTLNVVI